MVQEGLSALESIFANAKSKRTLLPSFSFSRLIFILFCFINYMRPRLLLNATNAIMEKRTFQVNLGGIINLLSNHLYSSNKVFIRELLQNANDAITAAKQQEPLLEPTINIELIKQGDSSTIMIEDNGIGLTNAEIVQFLSSVGSSIKRDAQIQRDTFIGQFGVGLLSCFMVCESIILITKSRKDDTAHKWQGFADGNYVVDEIDGSKHTFGTKVFIELKENYVSHYDAERVKMLVRKYANFLPYPINFDSGDGSSAINEQQFPWEKNVSRIEKHDEMMRVGQKLFDKSFIDYIPITIPKCGVEGMAYISSSSSARAKSLHHIYLKRMLLTENGEDLFPEWAFFVNGFIDTERLNPTASREDFYKDEYLAETKKAIAKQIKEYFIELGENDPHVLVNIIHSHYLAFKAMASEDDDFFELIVKWLKFRTSTGECTLPELVKQSKKIQYTEDVDKFKQISPLAQAKDICIVNAGYAFDTELLKRFSAKNEEVSLYCTDTDDFVNMFETISVDERNVLYDFMMQSNEVLSEFDCKLEIRRYSPDTLPSVYFMSDHTMRMRKFKTAKEQSNQLWGGILNEFLKQQEINEYSKLCLNLNNNLIQKLVKIKSPEMLRNFLVTIYINALLLGHHPLSTKEMKYLTSSLAHIMELGIQNAEN